MGVNNFSISTNHPFNKYNAGQSVRGRVHFTLDAPQTVRGVYVRFKGVAEVKWTESRKRTHFGETRTDRTRYHGEHEYFNEKIYFIGEANGESFDLKPGEYNYKFEYALPVGLPSSYEGPLGGVFYSISAGLDKHWAFDNEETIKLQIKAPLNLNSMPHLKLPGHVTCSKDICCLWCQSGPLTMEIDIPKTGFAEGETIQINADITNQTNSVVTMLEFELKQVISFHSEFPSHHTKSIDETLCLVQVQSTVPSKSSRIYQQKLKIPEHDVLNFNDCNLLNVKYELKIKAHIDGCHSNLSDKIPIRMGTIPITFGPMKMEPVSILAGYGTPYPYETEQINISQNASVQYKANYGWAPWSKSA